MGDSRTEQYPRDLLQFERQFGTEEACRDYLATLRWPEGFPMSWLRFNPSLVA